MRATQLLIRRVFALPLVGLGAPYRAAGVDLIGPEQARREMPSGGFVYMDAARLAGDVGAGLVGLTLSQLAAVRAWAGGARPGGCRPGAAAVVLVVGDLFPLAVASLLARPLPYVFVGCAKSEVRSCSVSTLSLAGHCMWRDELAYTTLSSAHYVRCLIGGG